MEVQIDKCTSKPHDSIGGGPQGSLVGQLRYIIASDNVVVDIPQEDKFKYIDDLSGLEAVQMKGKFEFNIQTFKTQKYRDGIS